MKQLTKLAVVAAMAIAVSAHAVPTLTIHDGSAPDVVVTAAAGNAVGTFGDSYWAIVITTAFAAPPGFATDPTMDVSIQATALGAKDTIHNLTVTWSATGFGPFNGLLAGRITGHATGGTGRDVTFNTYYDAGNVLNAETTSLTSSGTLTDPPGYNSDLVGTVNQSQFSLTEVLTIAGSPAGLGAGYAVDGSIGVAPSVPDGGMTVTLLGAALSGLALIRRRITLRVCRVEKSHRKVNMARGLKVTLAGAALAGLTSWANAAATLTLYDGVNPLITVVDNGPGDLIGLTGSIVIHTNVGVWVFAASSSETKPIFGSATDPRMDVNIQAYSTAAGSLRVVFSDDDFGPASGILNIKVDGHLVSTGGATVTYDVYGDPANVVGATTLHIASAGTTPLPTTATGSGTLTLPTPYSLTQVITIIAASALGVDVEASYYVGASPGAVGDGTGGFGFTAALDSTGANLVLRTRTDSSHNYVLQSSPASGAAAVWSGIVTNAGTGGVITNVVPVDPAKSPQFFRYKVE